MVSPDSPEAANGISKSRKTILNKTRADDVFIFRRSGTLFDFLRKEGCGSVESYLKDKFRVDVTLKIHRDDFEEENNFLKFLSLSFSLILILEYRGGRKDWRAKK